jgi:hypothetical protein
MSHLSIIPLCAHPSETSHLPGALAALPTGRRPALFLAVSASLVSKP